MFRSLLVPLDGSRLAEAALPPALSLAQTLGAPVTLLHILEKDAPTTVHQDQHLSRAEDAVAYLNQIAQRFTAAGVTVQVHVHTRPVTDIAESIVHHATREFNPDLIVMCAHGQGGLRDFLIGNIAQQVLSRQQAPILLCRPRAENHPPFTLRRLLLPLDDESQHDLSLDYAVHLARAYDAEACLLTVIPTLATLRGEQAAAGSLLPLTAAAYLDWQEEEAWAHLEEHLQDLQQAGIRAYRHVVRGDPAEQIVAVAEAEDADLIVLATHRKAGMAAFWAHSVAPQVVRRTRRPVLLIPL